MSRRRSAQSRRPRAACAQARRRLQPPAELRGTMRSKLLNADPPITYAVALDTGDEVIGELGKFVRDQEVEAASLTAIGAFNRAVLGYFQWEIKQYKKIAVDEQVEVFSLLGDVAVGDQGPTLHLHAVLGKSDGSVVGGHLIEGH